MEARTMNGRAEPLTRATDARLARIERQIAELAEANEAQIVCLRDATVDHMAAELAPLAEENAVLKKRVNDLERQLEQKMAVDQQVHEIAARLEERQERRDRDKSRVTDGDIQTMVIAQERESARKEFKAENEAMQRAFETMLTTKLEAFEQRIVQLTDQQIIERDGKDADPEAVARLVGEQIEEPLHEFIRAQVDTKLTALEERLKAVPGKLPVAKIWHQESVTYEGEFVCYEGALYQARKDTAQIPGGSDWVCAARAGHDGCDGRTPNVCGEYDARKTYAQLDVVAFDGNSFIAHNDDPGICPGPGWQPLSRQGRPGRRGESVTGPSGEKGEKGEPGPSIVSWQLDRLNYRVSPLMSNGTVGPMLELRGLFEQFQLDAT